MNQKLNVRDFMNCPVAGAIAGFCGSFFIVSPVFAQIIGATAGIVQVLVQNYI